MATTEEATLGEGIRVAIVGSTQAPDGSWYGPKGTATVAEDGRGYTVEWDDNTRDPKGMRWHFSDTPEGAVYDLVRLNEGE